MGKIGYKIGLQVSVGHLCVPGAGIYIDSKPCHAGKEANYWTSRPVKMYDRDDHANYLFFYNYDYEIRCTYRHYGHSVRPVSE